MALAFTTGIFRANAVNFDGTVDYLTTGAGLTAAADSKLVTLSFWFRATNVAADTEILAGVTTVGGATLRWEVYHSVAAARIQINAWNAAGTAILAAISNDNDSGAGTWHHVLYSCDLSSTSLRHFYFDDVLVSRYVTYTNDIIDFTLADWAIGAYASGTSKFPGDLAELWFKPGTYIDCSVTANRRLFIGSNLKPVYLGNDGSLPTGVAPLIYMSNVAPLWHNNMGTGGGFTKAGSTAHTAFPSPSGP